MTTPAERLKAVFDQAAEITSPADRAAFLGEACGGDAELRARVEVLLRAYAEAGSFLEHPVVCPAGTATFEPEPVGAMIGPYKLLQQIGEGGMGTVYMAEQTEPIRRKVALKIIKPGMDSRQVVARFEAERQALALMDHVNIARVLDAGTTDSGLPYFVMELVHGVPITKYCDDHHLTPRERLELFVPVCQAIQHAHQKGIIHRDIKPSNVLVTLHDGRPVPKVIDFGVAKATEQKLTERTLFTQYGGVVGTLEYMSPEQAEMSALGVDTRSDIYSLGVLLYELLTGSTPLSHERVKEAGFAEILRMIKEEEPPKPSTRLSDSGEALASISANRHMEPAKLTKLFRGEVDWIVMKALEKDRNLRYETANGFAADVQRHLNDETVHACPPSAAYRARKFVRRNRRALVTAAVVGVALLVGMGAVAGSLGWVVRDREARRVRTGVEVGQFLQRAEAHYADNRLPEAAAEVQKARGVLEAGRGDEELDRQVRQWLTDLDTAARLEEIRLEEYDLEDRDRGYADYARVFRDYGIDVEALSDDEATARVAASRIRLDLVLALGNWALRLQFDPRPQEPARRQRLLAIARAADPDPWRLRLVGAAGARDVQTLRELADGTDPTRARARTLAYLGNSLRTAGDAPAAVAFLRRAQREHPADFSVNSALALCLSELKDPPWDEVIAFRRVALAGRPRSAWAHTALGVALRNKGRHDEAVVEYRAAVRLRPGYVEAHTRLGIALTEQKQLDVAVASLRTAVALDPKYVWAHNNLGIALGRQKRLDDAIACYTKAIELDPKYVPAHLNRGKALHDQGKLEAAVASYRTAIGIDPKYAKAHHNLGHVLTDQGKPDEAVGSFRTAVALDPNNAESRYNLGVALMKQGKVDEAVTEYHKAIALDPNNAAAHNNLGGALAGQKKLDDALACYKTAIALDPKFALAHNNLGLALHAQMKWDEAVASYRKAIEADPNYADAHYNLGVTFHAQKKLNDALASYKRTIDLDPNYVKAHNNLGFCYLDRKEFDAAVAHLRKALDLDPKTARRHYNLGNALKAQGKLDAAIECYEAAIALDRNDAIPHYNLGLCYSDQKKWDAAVACFNTAIELDPKDPDARYSLGHALLNLNKLDEAIDWCNKAVALDPNCAKAHNVIGIALRRQNKLDAAVAEYRKAVALDPNNALFHNNLAVALRDQNKPDEAIAAFREAVRLKPDYAHAHLCLGNVLYRQMKWDDAIACYRTAVGIVPNFAEAHYGIGVALKAQGKVDEAIPSFRKVIALDPNHANAHTVLGNVLMAQGKVHDAVALFRKLVTLAPPSNLTWQNLGWLEYRTGNWRASVEALEKSCALENGGDCGQWIVMALAHARLGAETSLPEKARAIHQREARRHYERADRQIRSQWPIRPGHAVGQDIWDFRAEARKLMGAKEFER